MSQDRPNAESESSDPSPAGSPGPGSQEPSADLEALRQAMEKLTAQSEDRLQRWQRAQADLVNFRRRVEQERSDQTKYANERLIARILPVLDDFERAFGALPKEMLAFTWVEGVSLIAAKLFAVLQQEGLRPIEALGARFDPHEHEAVVVEPGVNVYDGEVSAELQRGYRLNERVLRATLVKVGPAKPQPDQEAAAAGAEAVDVKSTSEPTEEPEQVEETGHTIV